VKLLFFIEENMMVFRVIVFWCTANALQRRSWTFYETVKICMQILGDMFTVLVQVYLIQENFSEYL